VLSTLVAVVVDNGEVILKKNFKRRKPLEGNEGELIRE
jgi:hypothetical protein